jgi:hypothetical protein
MKGKASAGEWRATTNHQDAAFGWEPCSRAGISPLRGVRQSTTMVRMKARGRTIGARSHTAGSPLQAPRQPFEEPAAEFAQPLAHLGLLAAGERHVEQPRVEKDHDWLHELMFCGDPFD